MVALFMLIYIGLNSHPCDNISERRANLSKQVKRCIVVGTEHLQVDHCIRRSFDRETPPTHKMQSRTRHSRNPFSQLHPFVTGVDLQGCSNVSLSNAKNIMFQVELLRAFVPFHLLLVHFLHLLLHDFFIPSLQC